MSSRRKRVAIAVATCCAGAAVFLAVRSCARDDVSEYPVHYRTAGRCWNRFVPTDTGSLREYRVLNFSHGQSNEMLLTLEATGVQERTAGELSVSWRSELRSAAIAEPLQSEMRLRCFGQDGEWRAEEPWDMGLLPGLTIENRWSWPTELRVGVQFGSRALLHGPGATPERSTEVTVERLYTVVALESVGVSAGQFNAWRVEFESLHTVGDEEIEERGTQWVAEDIGLVRADLVYGDERSTLELLRYTGAPRRRDMPGVGH